MWCFIPPWVRCQLYRCSQAGAGDAQAGAVGDGSLEEGDGAVLGLVGMDLAEGQAGAAERIGQPVQSPTVLASAPKAMAMADRPSLGARRSISARLCNVSRAFCARSSDPFLRL